MRGNGGGERPTQEASGNAPSMFMTSALMSKVKPLSDRVRGTVTSLTPPWSHFPRGTLTDSHASCRKKFR